MYSFVKRNDDNIARHFSHAWEEWHAYLCDLEDAPEWVGDDDCGICCHTCETVIVETVC